MIFDGEDFTTGNFMKGYLYGLKIFNYTKTHFDNEAFDNDTIGWGNPDSAFYSCDPTLYCGGPVCPVPL